MQKLADYEVVGPITLGLNKPVHVVQINCSIHELVNMATIAAVDAILRKSQK
jgi:malate dehydrogenase (oxaloacetate-decarboxylating)(NADP+)